MLRGNRGFAFRTGRRFLSSERGTILPFAIVSVVLLVMFGSIAVNAVRIETNRSTMQATLDICVLNAAALKQTLDEREVFNDCIVKNRFPGQITNLTVTEGYSSKAVSASARAEMEMWFMRKFVVGGEDQYLAPDRFAVQTTSGAAERVGNVEVALVLDVSGSMADNNRLPNMKAAARDFVTTLLADDTEGRVSITLVPYNGQVNLGPRLASKFNVQGAPTGTRSVFFQSPISAWRNVDLSFARCVDLPSSVYTAGSAAIARNLVLPATKFADTFTSTTTSSFSYVSPTTTSTSTGATLNPANVWCQPSQANWVLLPDQTAAGQQGTVATPTQRIQRLHNAINALEAVGATSINAGMRWGLALLDPTMRGIYDEFIDSNEMPNRLRNRPLDYNDPDTMKIVVLMSDGSNFEEQRMQGVFRSSTPTDSPVYLASDGNYSIFHDRSGTTSDFWVPHLGAWRTVAHVPSGGTVRQIAWSEVFERVRASWVAWQLYARPFSNSSLYNTQMNAFRGTTSISTMDTQLQTVCTTARNRNVVVYTIAFDAPDAGRTQLRNCAHTVSRYYLASNTTISQVFASIAANISKLRLTQ